MRGRVGVRSSSSPPRLKVTGALSRYSSLLSFVENEKVILIFRYLLGKMYACKGSKALTAVTFVSFVMTSALPFLNGLFVDFLIYDKSVGLVVRFALLVAVVGAFSVALTYAAEVISMRVTSETAFSVLAGSVFRLEHANLEVVEGMETSYAAQRISADANAMSSFVTTHFLSMFLNGLLAVFVVAVFSYIDPWLILLSSTLMIAYVVLFLRLRGPLYESSLKKKEADSTFFNVVSSQIEQVFDTQLRSDYEGSAMKLKASFGYYLPVVMSTGRVSYLFSSMDGIISTAFQVVILLLAGIRIVQGEMTVGQLTMINAYFAMLLQCAKYYIGFYGQYQDALASYGRIRSIVATPALYEGNLELDHITEVELRGLRRSVRRGTKKELYGGLTHVFRRGVTCAIVGENGSGKSTLLKLLVGLYDSRGAVLYNGCPLSDLNMGRVRQRCIAVVPQTPHATGQPVRDYVADRVNVEPASVEELLASGSDVPGITRVVIELLDKRCDSLSGGEMRKLSLLLALRRHSDVLILDEPSAGLDVKGEEELVKYIKDNKYYQTIIVMTHDRKLIRASQEAITLN